MAGLDLSGIKRLVDSWLVDEILVGRDNGETDDELDEETGQLIPTPDVQVYAGLGVVQSISGFSEVPDPDVQRVVEETGADYRALLPLEVTAEFVVGDLVRVTAQHTETQDPRLMSRRFRVVDLGGASSYAVLQILYLKQVGIVREPAAAPAPDSGMLAEPIPYAPDLEANLADPQDAPVGAFLRLDESGQPVWDTTLISDEPASP